ncbi:NlpC/P60 family protein [Streptomyces decoyicus]|uniref:NlpC/P60 family protein n=1 Tax=Streptomyces decoyicus TaxID=249567 RepID=UPI003629AF18
MSAGKKGAMLGVGVVVLPVTLLFSFGGDDEHTPRIGAAGLDVKQIPAEYATWIEKAAKTCPLITGPVIAAQIDAESGWNPKAKSPVGAEGIAQFMPGTWKTWGMDADSKDGSGKPDGVADPYTAGDGIMTQARYDCWLAKKVKSYKVGGDLLRLTLAAYNAGPDKIREYGGIPPYAETQAYVKSIMGLTSKYTAATDDGGASGFGGRVIAQAIKWKGTPYSWGGGTIEGPSTGFGKGEGVKGFDCSSLVQYAIYHASHGKTLLPRTSQAQVKEGKHIDPSEMKPGDVVGFALNGAGNYDHIAIFMGGGQVVHAPKPGQSVKVASISEFGSAPKEVRRFG